MILGLYAFGYALGGWLRERTYQKKMWDLASVFTLGLYIQIVTGFLVIFSTTNRSFDRSLGLHMILSVVATVLAQMTYTMNRRRPRDERRYLTHVWGIGLALLLVIAGIVVIRVAALS
jgi:uncharacterized membrane protein